MTKAFLQWVHREIYRVNQRSTDGDEATFTLRKGEIKGLKSVLGGLESIRAAILRPEGEEQQGEDE